MFVVTAADVPLLQEPCVCPRYAGTSDEELLDVARRVTAEGVAVLDAVAADPSPATAESVLHPVERMLVPLRRVVNMFCTRSAADFTPAREEREASLWGIVQDFLDTALLHRGLHSRLEALAARAAAGEVSLDEQDSWLLSEMLRERAEGGAALDAAGQARLRELNQEIAEVEARMAGTALKASDAAAVHVTDPSRLAGLSADQTAALAADARARGVEGYVIDLVNTTQQPLLAYLEDRSLREELFTASTQRGFGGEHDTRAILLHMLHLRQERAELLGYRSAAEQEAGRGSIGSVGRVRELLAQVAPVATANARREAAVLQEHFERTHPGETFQPWDWAYTLHQVRRERQDLASDDLAPYLELESVLERGVFGAAELLYGLTFSRRDDIPGYTDGTRTYEVHDADGSLLGLFLFDPYTTRTRQGGAWMTPLVDQGELIGDRPVVTTTLNLAPPAPGRPCLLGWDMVETLFHEFGHALHGLLSQVRYPSRSGTNVPRDLVEFPSQVNEMWAAHPAVLARYARHHETGEPMPADWPARLDPAGRFGDGFAMHEAASAMVLDQAWHDGRPLPSDPEDVAAFEEAALREAGVWLETAPPRYRSTYFLHIFGGGYSAGYYDYLWSEVLDADCVAWIREQGDDLRAIGTALRDGLLAKGGSVDLLAAYERLTGRPADPRHLMERHALV